MFSVISEITDSRFFNDDVTNVSHKYSVDNHKTISTFGRRAISDCAVGSQHWYLNDWDVCGAMWDTFKVYIPWPCPRFGRSGMEPGNLYFVKFPVHCLMFILVQESQDWGRNKVNE